MDAQILMASGEDSNSRVLAPAFSALFHDVDESTAELRSSEQLIGHPQSSVVFVLTAKMVQEPNAVPVFDILERALREYPDLRMVTCIYQQLDDVDKLKHYPKLASAITKDPLILPSSYCLSRAANMMLARLGRSDAFAIVPQVGDEDAREKVRLAAMLLLRTVIVDALGDHRSPTKFRRPPGGKVQQTVSDAVRHQLRWAHDQLVRSSTAGLSDAAGRCINVIIGLADSRYRRRLLENFNDAKDAGYPAHTILDELFDLVQAWEGAVDVPSLAPQARDLRELVAPAAFRPWLSALLSATTDHAARQAFRALHAELVRFRKNNAYEPISSVLDALAQHGATVHPMLLVAGLRLTFLYRAEISRWTETRDEIARKLSLRGLDASELLQGLFE